ncbi:tyrosine-type recombinase/integrase [Paramuribaculum intestinale]|nr:site-specific integrase [Paramuribaculum intestinale]
MSKKMCHFEALKLLSQSHPLGYTYPKLHTGKSWYVDFYALDPATGQMRRKKYNLNTIKSKIQRHQYATELIVSIVNLLRTGWTPWQIVEQKEAPILLKDAFALYKEHVQRQQKEKSIKTNLSFLKLFEAYLDSLSRRPREVRQITTSMLVTYLDKLYLKQGVTARTRNNYRGFLSSLFTFFVDRNFIQSNPVDPIKNLTVSAKKRQPLTKSMLRRLNDYLSEHDKWMLLACRMEYYTFIRPGELRHIRINDISVKDMQIFVSGEISKNKRDANVAINREILTLMLDLGLFDYPGGMYIFGPGLRPSATIGDKNLFSREWCKLRSTLGWSPCYQFYSLKDSGIRDLANSAGIVVARDQARHTDISTTNRYLQGRDQPVHEEVIAFRGVL